MMGFDPATMMAAASAGISAGSTLLSAFGELRAANDQAKALDAQRYFDVINAQNKSQALRYAGQDAMAGAQRQVLDSVTDKKLALSKATALAAAGGGGTTDATVVKVMGDIEKQGAYNKALALFAGENQMRQLDSEARNALIEGQNVANARGFQAGQLRRQGRMKAAGTLLSGAASTADYLRRKAPAGLGLASEADLEIADAKAKSARDLLDWQNSIFTRRYFRDE